MSKDLIFTASGIRGIAGEALNKEIVQKICLAYGSWLKEKRVILCRDTRPSGRMLRNAVVKGLSAAGCEIINLGICPTPVLIYEKNLLKIPGGIIITGSHNPQEWNALKLLSNKTFLSEEELAKISVLLERIDKNQFPIQNQTKVKILKNVDAIPHYINELYKHIDLEIVKENNLRVVVDPGAGAGKGITSKILEGLGCEVKEINAELIGNSYPREIEPIEKNLKDLIVEVWRGKYDIGFAHDCDADRLAIIGDDFKCYPEDMGLALITEHNLRKAEEEGKKVTFVTNLASSLMFEALAEKYHSEIIRTPIGERHLAEKMEGILKLYADSKDRRIVFGGEGSCGGIMEPSFNNARDGIYAAAKIVEILVESKEKISTLVKKLLPKYYTTRDKIDYKSKKISSIIEVVKNELQSEGEIVHQVGLDLRFGEGLDWFVLIHPSNTEPIIRVISEAKRESLAKIYCETAAELVRLAVSKV
ncbi:MAG: hypothetical protein ACTSR8_09335 [Promethearchaeota archaeon]